MSNSTLNKFKTSSCYQPQICSKFLKSCQPNPQDPVRWVWIKIFACHFHPYPTQMQKSEHFRYHIFLPFCTCWMLCPKGLCSSKGRDSLAAVNWHELRVKLSSTAIIFPGGRHEGPKAWSINHPWIRDTETSLPFLHQLNAECPIGLCSGKRNDSVACQLKSNGTAHCLPNFLSNCTSRLQSSFHFWYPALQVILEQRTGRDQRSNSRMV